MKSSSKSPSFVVTSLTVILLSCLFWIVNVEAQVTVTTTETRTNTQTVYLSSNYICAKIVNVTGVCRRRRGFKLDEPVVLTFDEDLDIDLYSPTKTLSVEATAEAQLPTAAIVMAPQVIESSTTSRSTRANNNSPMPRIYFAELNALFNRLVSNIIGLRTTISVTQYEVTTTTTTIRTGTTTSFFVMGCTPSPFPYDVCSGKRRRR